MFADLSSWAEHLEFMVNDKFIYDDVFGIMFSYPNTYGEISIPQKLIDIIGKGGCDYLC